MSLVVFANVGLGFGKKQLVDGLDLRIGRGDRIGLVGPNGSGKSSLMKMVAGQLEPDAGSLNRQRGLRVGYLAQDLSPPTEQTVLQTVVRSVPGRAELETERDAAERELAESTDEGNEERMMEAATWIADVHERLAGFEQTFSEHEAHRILAGLGFADHEHDRDIGELSGGWRMRAMLAALLFSRPDLLLLDEPTNHLDLPTVAWFGAFLRRYPASFVLICHDREFLNEQIDRVVSLEPEGVRQFRGNFEQYVKQRVEEEIVLENQARNLEREREKAEQFIERFRAQANKAKAVQSRIKQLAKMDEVQTFTRRKVMRFSFPACQRAGNEVLRVEGLAKRFDAHTVFEGVDLRVARGDRIGIIGVNGAGKTTLLRTVANELQPNEGEITLGHKVKLGYYAQHHADTLSGSQTILESVSERNRGEGETAVRNMLGAFLFSDEDVDKPIRVLSGGERARVALARLLVDPGNLVLMDEPTNHLDLESSDSLAESLATYDGTLVFVSHNRSFVRKLANRIWNVENGAVEDYPGTLDEYLERHRAEEGGRKKAATAVAPTESTSTPAAKPSSATKSRPVESRAEKKARKREEAERRAKEQRTLGPLRKKITALEATIEELETVQRQRNLDLADPVIYGDAPRRNELLTAYQDDQQRLSDASEAWEAATMELEELSEDA